MMVDMGVRIGSLFMQNPVTTASGTFAAGKQYDQFFNIGRLGAVTTKGVAPVPWDGNSGVRITETPSGMLNSIGLQNPGVEAFCKGDLAWLATKDVPIIVNVAGHSISDFQQVIERLEDEPAVGAYELNISCPNVDQGGMTFGVDPQQAASVMRVCRELTSRPIIVKLTPNVTDITVIAQSVVDAGADAVSLINTVLGMAIDARTRKAVMGRKVGGLSGPAIKPIALRMVYEVASCVQVPIIGMGGISNATDAIEFILAGATAVAVGTANFMNPCSAVNVVDGISQYCIDNGVSSISELVGALQ